MICFPDATQNASMTLVGKLLMLKQTSRSPIARDVIMRLVGDDRSFLRESLKTANSTSTFPKMIIGEIIIDRTLIIVERGFTLSRL